MNNAGIYQGSSDGDLIEDKVKNTVLEMKVPSNEKLNLN